MNQCAYYRKEFSAYLDGAMTGAVMHEIAAHLEACSGCAAEFAKWRNVQSLVSSLGPAKAPPNLSFRLRVALSQQTANTAQEKFPAAGFAGKIRSGPWCGNFRPV